MTWLVVGPLSLFADCSGWLSAVWLTGWWVQLCSLQPCCCCYFLGDQLQVSFKTVIHLKHFVIPEYKSIFSHGHWEGSRFRLAVKEQSLSSAYFFQALVRLDLLSWWQTLWRTLPVTPTALTSITEESYWADWGDCRTLTPTSRKITTSIDSFLYHQHE